MKAALYARYSSENQREESIEAQLRAMREYCTKNEIIIVKTYIDEAYSATTDKRPNFQQMFEDSKKQLFDTVIIHKFDRFARNRYDSAIYKKKLKENKVKLISILENLDDSPEGIILEAVLEGFAEYYSANLAREVKKGLKENALAGRYNGGPTPFGYFLDKNKNLAINEPEAEIVKIIYDLYLSGDGYSLISHYLNKNGYKTRKNSNFSKISIRDILLNEKYCGTYVYGRRADGKTLDIIRPDEEIIRVTDAHPAIITYDVYNLVQAKMKSEGKKVRKLKKIDYMLTGKLFCQKCLGSYTGIGYITGKNRNNKYYMYGCVSRKKNKSCDNKAIRKDLLEQKIIEKLKTEIFSTQTLDEIANIIYSKINDFNSGYFDEMKKVKNNIQSIDAKIKKTWELFYADMLDKETVATQIKSLQEDKKNLEEKQYNLQTIDYSWVTKDSLKMFLQKSKKDLESDELKKIKKVIEQFVDKIVIGEEHVIVSLIVKSPVPSVLEIKVMELNRYKLNT